MTTIQESVKLKEKQVKELGENILKSQTLIIANIKNLPSKQFQEIKKSLREHASIKVAKKNIMARTIKNIGGKILELEKTINSDCAFVISNLEGFELAGILSKKKTPVFASAGQIAIDNIEVKEGPTDLVPGPAISELNSLGLEISIKEGKIFIKKSKTIIKKGEIISKGAASLLQKLNIQPFKVGLKILAVYDVQKEKTYTDVEIKPEKYLEEIKTTSNKALGLARKINYYCKETLGYLLARANLQTEKLKSFIKA